ncbi:MAG: N-acetylmuramoyl-L-alanine amidase [Paludibacteraceae bacterium]|nr:N-acetylmuramoyl-L-alanine amidase [Paludibacteraceae bacterium]
MRKITEIIIHCSCTPEGRNIGATTILGWHKERGYNDIGYHYVIRLDGTIETGRPVEHIGAHCKGHNRNSIGICYVGGTEKDCKTPKDTRTPLQREALQQLCKQLKAEYPNATIHGHSDFANKACPSFNVEQWIKEVNL